MTAYTVQMRVPVLVGESNPHSDDPLMALFPYPRGASGDRLRRLLDMDAKTYLTSFHRVNLCDRRWDLKEARASAVKVLASYGRILGDHDELLLLGSKVARAFYAERVEMWGSELSGDGTCWVSLRRVPHPSGLCRTWNDPEAAAKLRTIVRMAGVPEWRSNSGDHRTRGRV